MLKLYAVCAAELDEIRFDAAMNITDVRRREKVRRLRFEKDRRLSLAAGILLAYSLKAEGVHNSEFYLGEKGKPYLKGNAVYFNLSHSGEWAICAVSDREIGCDIEKTDAPDLRIAKKFCREEYEQIQRAPELFYDYWTLKESFMKATGQGIALGLDRFKIVLDGNISVVQSFNDTAYYFKLFNEPQGYKCAVCMPDYFEDVEPEKISVDNILDVLGI